MIVTPTRLPEVLLLEPKVHGDQRGFFLESYNERSFEQALGRKVHFVQDNHSRSTRGILRGLHFQRAPDEQGKLVRVTSGRVFDVAVDVRPGSPDFGRWVGIELSGENFRQLWIPPGYAHGFLVLSDSADFLYKTTAYYAPQSEGLLRWDDQDVGIEWPLAPDSRPSLAPRDAAAPGLLEARAAGLLM